MRTAIMINMDYITHSAQECHRAWLDIETALRQCGFNAEGRLFTSNDSLQLASQAAEQAIAKVARAMERSGMDLGGLIKDFFAFEYQSLTELNPPAQKSGGIDVTFIDTGTFRAWNFLKTA